MLRILHEKEGVRLGRPLLKDLGYDETLVAEVCNIIDGHDTRPTALNLDDSLVKDFGQAVAVHRDRRGCGVRLVQVDPDGLHEQA